MQPIVTVVIATKSAFAQLHYIAAIMRHKQADKWVLYSQPGIIDVCEHWAIRLQHNQARVENSAAKPHTFDLSRKPLALFDIHNEAIHVFVIDHTADGCVKRYPLRFRRFVIWFCFICDRKWANKKSAQFGQPPGCANP